MGMDPIAEETHRNLDRPLTADDVTRVRGVWGAIQWEVSRTGPQHAATLREMQSKNSHPTLR